jgi:hypothetical protein
MDKVMLKQQVAAVIDKSGTHIITPTTSIPACSA